MFSLDKQIFDPTSTVAQRMVAYGSTDELRIVIPDRRARSFDLSRTVHVVASGGESKIGQYLRLYQAGRRILRSQTINRITAQDPFFLGLLGLMLGRRSGLPFEAQVHGDFFGSDYYQSGLMSRLRLLIGKFVVHRATVVRVVGERVRQSLVRLGVAAEKIVVRPVPVEAAAIQTQPVNFDLHQKFPEADKIFIAIGRFDPVKNFVWLIDVFAAVARERPTYRLLIFGDGRERVRLEQRIASHNLPGQNIRLEAATRDPVSCLKTAAALLVPSLSEGYGLVAMEALAAGTAVIMNDVGVANFELKPGPKVTILPINDQDAWIQALLQV